MRIAEILRNKDITLSFEIFPPKVNDSEEVYKNILSAAYDIAQKKPDFMSVTCGAGGGKNKQTLPMVDFLNNSCNVTPIAHMTCVSVNKELLNNELENLKVSGVQNILALRGDIPQNNNYYNDFVHANELVSAIKHYGNFCIGGACYPEKHIESKNIEEDIHFLKQKVDAGCDFITTQMFFDNDKFYKYIDQIRKIGVNVPVLAGIMPITNAKSIIRSCELSGASIPERLKIILDKYSDNPTDMYKAGIEYAENQIDDLLRHNFKHIHLYTMNKPQIADQIKKHMNL